MNFLLARLFRDGSRGAFAGLLAAIPLGVLLVAIGAVRSAANPLFAPPVSYVTGFYPYSVAIGDLNGDGKRDVAVANYDANTVSVLLGNGDGTLSAKTDFATGDGPSAVAIADMNGDNKPDLVVADFGPCCSFPGSVSVLLGHGDGIFGVKTDFATANGPWHLAIGDFNGDSKRDVATASNFSDLSNSVSVLLGNGDGTLNAHTDYPTGTGPRSVAIGDLNGDGRPDVAVANKIAGSVSVKFGNGDGSLGAGFELDAGSNPQSVAIGDVNGDFKRDLAVAKTGTDPDYLGSVAVRLGNGDGTFGLSIDYATGNAPSSVAIGDLNGDGHPDLVTANLYGSFPINDGSVSVLLGNGDGTFQPKTDYATDSGPISVAVADLSGDLKPEVATANPDAHTVSVLLNIGVPPASVEPGGARLELALQGCVPNPSRRLNVSFTLPDSRPATLEVHDVSGREVDRMEVGGLGAGRHTVTLGSSGKLAPGVYLVHLIQAEHRRVARAIVLR